MRALMVLCALVVTPLLVATTQGLPGKSSCVNGSGTANRSVTGTANAHKGLCQPQDPPPPPPPPPTGGGDPGTPPPPPPPSASCGNASPNTGTGSIVGQVFVDQSPWPLLAGWCVELRDASGAVVATALSTGTAIDGDGDNFAFSGLPAGAYTACEVVQTGWTATYPTFGQPCGSGMGYAVTLTDGASAGFIWFGNVSQ